MLDIAICFPITLFSWIIGIACVLILIAEIIYFLSSVRVRLLNHISYFNHIGYELFPKLVNGFKIVSRSYLTKLVNWESRHEVKLAHGPWASVVSWLAILLTCLVNRPNLLYNLSKSLLWHGPLQQCPHVFVDLEDTLRHRFNAGDHGSGRLFIPSTLLSINRQKQPKEVLVGNLPSLVLWIKLVYFSRNCWCANLIKIKNSLSQNNNYKFGLAQWVFWQNANVNYFPLAQFNIILHESVLMFNIAQGDRTEPASRIFGVSVSDFFVWAKINFLKKFRLNKLFCSALPLTSSVKFVE